MKKPLKLTNSTERKQPVNVAVELSLSEKEATKYYKEYWRLNHLYRLYQVYMEIADSLPSFLKSYKVFKRKGLTTDKVEWVANAIEAGVIKLPELQHDYKNLQNKVQTMQYQKQKLERDLHVIQKQIMESTEVENMLHQNVDTLQDDIEHLHKERSELQQLVYRFKNSDRRYLQIRRMAEEVADRLLAERKSLLTSALVAVIEALRMNPDRYAVIYNSKYDNNDNVFESITGACIHLSSNYI